MAQFEISARRHKTYFFSWFEVILLVIGIALICFIFINELALKKRLSNCIVTLLLGCLVTLLLLNELKWLLQLRKKHQLVSGHYMGKCFEALKADQLEEAQSLVDESIKYDNKNFRNWLLLARIAVKQDDDIKAKGHIATAAEKLGPDPSAKDMAFLKEQHGVVLVLLDELPQGIALLRQAQKLNRCKKRDELIGRLEARLVCDDDAESF